MTKSCPMRDRHDESSCSSSRGLLSIDGLDEESSSFTMFVVFGCSLSLILLVVRLMDNKIDV